MADQDGGDLLGGFAHHFMTAGEQRCRGDFPMTSETADADAAVSADGEPGELRDVLQTDQDAGVRETGVDHGDQRSAA